MTVSHAILQYCFQPAWPSRVVGLLLPLRAVISLVRMVGILEQQLSDAYHPIHPSSQLSNDTAAYLATRGAAIATIKPTSSFRAKALADVVAEAQRLSCDPHVTQHLESPWALPRCVPRYGRKAQKVQPMSSQYYADALVDSHCQ